MGFNKSSQQSSSENRAFPFLKDALGGTVGFAGSSAQSIADLLSGNSSGFDAFKRATGFNQMLSRGMQGITGAGAARGLLRSGSTGKALVNYGQEKQNETAQSYLQNLLGLGQLGIGAGGVISSAGNTSQSSGKSKGLSLSPVKWGG